MSQIHIDGRAIGEGCPPYIIAELSANHNGSIEEAFKTIDAAVEAGADAIKLQTYTPDTLTIDCDQEDFLIKGGLWDGHKLYDLYKLAQTPFEWMEPLFSYARKKGITVFSTPFDESALDCLEALDPPAYKIASFEMTDLPLVKAIAELGRPIIMSTGMATLEEVEETVSTIYATGNREIALLHCISAYPAPLEQANLLNIKTLKDKFECVVGLSDHTLGHTAALTSMGIGASLVEKHFILDRKNKGPDSEFSIEPQELKQLCEASRGAWSALGSGDFKRSAAEKSSKKFRRSLYFVRDVKAGQILTKDDVRRIRPGYGLEPKYYDDVIGRTVDVDVTRGTALCWDQFRT